MALIVENIYIDIFIIFITLFVSLRLYFKHAFNYWKRKGVETLAPIFPFGNASELIMQTLSIGDVFEKYYSTMKSKGLKYCGYYTFSKPNLIVIDPELLKTILTKDFHHFSDRGIYYNEEVDPLSAHLLTLSGSKWKDMRARLSPAFTSGKMKIMFDTLLNCTKELIIVMDNITNNHQDFDVKEVFGRFFTDVIGSCAFGIECNSLQNPNSDFRKYGKMAIGQDFWDQLRNVIAVIAPNIMETFQMRIINTEVSNFFLNIVKETIRYREKNDVVRKDFMHLLIQLKNNITLEDEDNIGQLKLHHSNNEVSLTEEQIAAEAFVFFVAGFETSSTTLTFCLYEMATNLDIQEKLRNEIKEVLDDYEGKLTYDAIMEMTYMDKCINETLRKHPPIPTHGRICTESYKIPDSDVIIEKGSFLIIPVSGIHHDPEYYPEPGRFDPERFSSESKLNRHHFAWIPFGEGPRICIGMRFGLMQIKVALSILLGNYKFSLSPKTRIPLIMDPEALFPTAKGGIWLNVENMH